MPFTRENAGEYARRRWAKYTPEERRAYASRMRSFGATREYRSPKREARLMAELEAAKKRLGEIETLLKKSP